MERKEFLQNAFETLSEEHEQIYGIVKKNLDKVSDSMKKDLKYKWNIAN